MSIVLKRVSRGRTRGVMAALGILMTAGMITAPNASAAFSHNVMLTGAAIPNNVRSVLIEEHEEHRDGVEIPHTVGCVVNIPVSGDVNTRVYVVEGRKYSFRGLTDRSCSSDWRERHEVVCACNKRVPQNLAAQNYWVQLVPQR
jgi:hypothetical protein